MSEPVAVLTRTRRRQRRDWKAAKMLRDAATPGNAEHVGRLVPEVG